MTISKFFVISVTQSGRRFYNLFFSVIFGLLQSIIIFDVKNSSHHKIIGFLTDDNQFIPVKPTAQSELINLPEENLDYIEIYEERFLSCLRIITNCLLSDETLKTFEIKRYDTIT